MTSKKALIISGVSVAVILLLSFGVLRVMAQINGSVAGSSSLTERIINREEDYKKLIEEANRRIQELNSQIEKSSSGLQDSSKLPLEMIVSVAVQAAGNDHALAGVPQLVNFQGISSYEIPFVDGLMYIDAATGTILASNLRQIINEQEAIQIAADYLGVLDSSIGVVKVITLDGVEIYQVFIANYVLYVDKYGEITRMQVIDYSSQNNSQSNDRERDDDHDSENEHDDDD